MGRQCDLDPFLFPSAFPSTSPSLSTSTSTSTSSSKRSFFSSSSSPSLNSPFQPCPSSSSFLPSSSFAASTTDIPVPGPCAACKFLRRRCTDKCYLATYFPPSESHKYTVVDKVFGASNIAKFLQENYNNPLPYVPMLLVLRDASQDGESQLYPSSNNGVQAPPDVLMNLLTNDNIGTGNDNSKHPQHHQLLSSKLPQMSTTFPSSRANPPMFQPTRTYTKVYKSGSVGRKIDITRYSGYDELKKDLCRMFGITEKLEDEWKLVYGDRDNDILFVGEDPWDEFVDCVCFVKMLSPREFGQLCK